MTWLQEQLDKQGRVYSINGFFSQVGASAKYNEFRVVDAQASQAARLGFADQAGAGQSKAERRSRANWIAWSEF